MSELGLFLRTRRAAVTPADVGLPAGARRRTPGLRRTEVAALAGVSVEYVTRLEQGRDRHPSPQVLSALADALRLSTAERVHLHRLTKAADPGFTCRGPGAAPALSVRAPVRALLDRLEPAPAAVFNRLGDVVASTPAFAALMRAVGLLDLAVPNMARFVLADPRARSAFPDWEVVADDQVAALKSGPFRADPAVAALADELTVTAGEAFTGRVSAIPGLPRSSGVLRMAHPAAGALRLDFETLELPADDDQRLVVYLPADPATAAALTRLTTQPLRLVAG
ncbi:helix-turn-helix domain-containing protein [Dactylosporangium matsuzakiense]|uniref:DNA-binding protein n=1 Tax=Dactylosporangium matsuzakiense TaxID=53360 RepID=A0A9W6KPD7_9ACTN|nr:helix-turn-helix transcriptional regulator [Dactylosporangium matsuzakiense]UWZ42639.1 helix-turn-helix domain-containing protein [Dactylosporangium matsuzakiense]GLL03890.1 DNA-binding protein [Dactylosporangium matsuzakiense]